MLEDARSADELPEDGGGPVLPDEALPDVVLPDEDEAEELAIAEALDAEFAEGVREQNQLRDAAPALDTGDDTLEHEDESLDATHGEPADAPPPPDAAAEVTRARFQRAYWQAEGLVELELSHFAAGVDRKDEHEQRASYYRLAIFHGRTLSILRTALAGGREPLARAAMRNLATLHRAMAHMHQRSPGVVPVTLILDAQGRDGFARDLVVRALSESPTTLSLEAIVERVNDLDVMGVRPGTVERHIGDLVATGHVTRTTDRPALYRRAARTYTEIDNDQLGLQSLVGPEIYRNLEKAGFRGLGAIAARQAVFRSEFARSTRMSEVAGAQFAELAVTLSQGATSAISTWRHFDLVGSPYPRPYQHEAYAVFRGYGYKGQVVESPTGSGKTLIGMMCVQDWLRTLRPGQSILILVPTAAYLQQWTGELCYKPIGLRLSPEVVFSGTPAQLERFQKQTGSHPAILLMTYTSLAQAGSGVGKGGFDVDSIEMFLQSANVQYMILDEVHKVVEDMQSVSTAVTRLMVEWLRDSSLLGLIGFSGTAEAYRNRFDALRLQLVYNIPMDELVAAGYVAPFTELGVPFSNSRRERQIRDLLDAYKAGVVAFVELVGPANLRRWFAEIAVDERVRIGYEYLNMYRGRSDWRAALTARLSQLERGDAIKLTDLGLVSIVQIATGQSDLALVRAAGADEHAFAAIVASLDEIRARLAELIYLPQTLERLAVSGFSHEFDVAALHTARAGLGSHAARAVATKDHLARTIVGLYEGLSEWYRRVGEGRVETIKAVIEAERAVRPVTGIIVFDVARRIVWEKGVATPGYEGVGGLYAQMLGDERFVPYAVLSTEQYLPFSADDPLPLRVSEYIEDQMMAGEISEAMFELATQGLDLEEAKREELEALWKAAIAEYLPRLANVHAVRPGDFTRRVVQRIRRRAKSMKLGAAGQRLAARMDLRNVHFAGLVRTFFDYAIIARYFREPRIATLEQVSGAQQRFFVVPMPGGARKQLMYDLTARLVDAPELPFNLIIVSSWARTGWNVIAPNVLIDATATRDVTAWQQLRGRAIRARRTWTNDCYRLLMILIGSRLQGLVDRDDVPEDVTASLQQGGPAATEVDANLRALLEEVAPNDVRDVLAAGGVEALSDEQRARTAVALMQSRNKVTHIYELIKSFGSTIQVEYDRPAKRWQRKENIALKHAREIAVDIFTGAKSTGDGHAPLIYVADPRNDLPEQLEARLSEVLKGGDATVVSGWMGTPTGGSIEMPPGDVA